MEGKNEHGKKGQSDMKPRTQLALLSTFYTEYVTWKQRSTS